MREHRTAAITAGVLYIVGTVAGVVCKFLVQGPVQDADDPLAYAGEHPHLLVTGALLVLTMGLALVLVSVVLFPILRRYDEALAIGYLTLRGAVEAASARSSLARRVGPGGDPVVRERLRACHVRRDRLELRCADPAGPAAGRAGDGARHLDDRRGFLPASVPTSSRHPSAVVAAPTIIRGASRKHRSTSNSVK
jgi:hypothetical protein